jgi:hypothetical protein
MAVLLLLLFRGAALLYTCGRGPAVAIKLGETVVADARGHECASRGGGGKERHRDGGGGDDEGHAGGVE